MNTDINFPNLHIYFSNVGKSIEVFGISIAYYGIIIALAMLLGVSLILYRAKKAGESQDDFLDICIITIVISVIGARIYYVVFAWDYYKDDILSIFNIRQGGLAIYGGVLAGILTVCILCHIKKIKFWKAADIIIPGLVVGQLLGRWGNFFNREAFGGYTNNLLAMELPLNAVRSMDDITEEMLAHSRIVDGVTYVQVHPTFLYESLWNLALLLFLLFMTKRKKFDGELFLDYLFFYGLGRVWIESLRTDQLKMIGTDIPVSQVLAVVLMILAVILYFVLRSGKSKPTEK
jgi:phosphatidylglycerol:prolipoprotein diacylglycerol transferase